MIRLGGLSFEVGPLAHLTAEERASLDRLSGPSAVAPSPFRLRLWPEPPWPEFDPGAFVAGEPARIDWVDGRVRVSHRDFAADLDPRGLEGRLFRRTERAYGLEIALRVAMAARLPLEGGVPLHAAGLVIDGHGVVFFGPSGAGKSTLAALSPHPVLSDELVAVVAGRPFEVVRTGFWGTLGRGDAPPEPFPLKALVELDKAPGFQLTRLAPRAALRRLLGVILVPIGPPLWTAALGVAGRLAREIPVYRMSWSPVSPPWEALARLL